TSYTCPANANKCGKESTTLSKSGTSITLSSADCYTTTGFSNGCYDLDTLNQLDPALMQDFEDAAAALGLNIDQYEMCLCDGTLCNGSIRASVNMLMVTSLAVIASFVALAS
uniref:hypothetical protein n=1 Tax=Salmonella sp. s54395 TaxID=3159664 RepID=UPI003981580E